MFGLFKKADTNTSAKKTLTSGLKNLFSLHTKIDDELFEELELLLISSDVGVDTTYTIIENVRSKASKQELKNSESLKEYIASELLALLPEHNALTITSEHPYVILVVGVNGAGKTTTIGKLAHRLKSEGKSVMLGAGDTFRAAAIEQLKVWGERNDIPVVAGKQGGDSAAILFDAYSSAKAKGVDVLIADTSGRLHTQDNLMAELGKIKNVLGKHGEYVPNEVMLVVDGTSGGNAVLQAKAFNEAVALTGITITKLDGSAKGGVVFAISDELNLPIRFIGVGEGQDDLMVFDPEAFVASIIE